MHDTAPAPTATPLTRAVDRLAGVAIAIAAAALLGLVAVQGWQVIARYVLNDSPSWTEPVTLLLLSTAMSLGAAAGVHTRRHFSFALLADAASPALQRAMQAAQAVVVLLIGALLAYWGTVLFVDGLEVPAAGIAMPDSIDYLPVAVGGALMTLFALLQLVVAPVATATAERG